MGKRSLDDAELADGVEATSTPVPVPKKSKKEKKEKRKRTEDTLPTPEVVASYEPQEVESKEARKERKRLKKLTKAKEVAKQNGTVEVEPEPMANEEPKDDKATRKAEKAKKEGNLESTSEVDTTTSTSVSTPIPNGSSGDTYVEDANLAALPQAEIDTFLADNFITITDPLSKTANLRPITKFSYLPVADPAHRAPFKDFKAPTPIQAAAWPFLLAGRDVIGVAETGSGKTSTMCTSYLFFAQESKEQGSQSSGCVSNSRTRHAKLRTNYEVGHSLGITGCLRLWWSS
jgi:ATP-dependent RNA helicase DBP3